MSKPIIYKIILFLVAVFYSHTGFTQEYSTIFIYSKKKFVASGISYKIYVNKLEIGQIATGGRLEYRYYKTGRLDIMCGVFSEYGGSDKYSDNITIEVEKGKTYYFKGEGKNLYLVSNDVGKAEFDKNSDFKGGIALNDDKPWNTSLSNSKQQESVSNNSIETENKISEPEIVLTSPKLSDEEFKTSQTSLKVSGYVVSKSNVKSVKLNGEVLPSDEVGNFSTNLKLKEGLNRVTIVVLNEKKQNVEKTFNIIKELKEEPVAVNNDNKTEEYGYRGSDPFKGTNVANASKEIKAGKYYALFIGIDTYSGTWKPLKNAVNDAKAIEALVKGNYKFDVVKNLYNAQATRSNIIDQLDWLVSNVKENDNVMIYYSGHGEFKKELNKGFWVPVDAKSNSTSNYISNSDIQTFLASIPSKHTLLVSDACFSGDIFRGSTTSLPFENTEKYYTKTYDLKSRQAISSGGLEPVMDGGKEGHSIFAYYLLQALKSNSGKYFDASQLYSKIKIPVTNNSDQSPEFNPISKAGDEGGNFIFIKK
ncbi:MAG: caspase family protein [Bacteroidia bacterium]|jgi:hypothetical protein